MELDLSLVAELRPFFIQRALLPRARHGRALTRPREAEVAALAAAVGRVPDTDAANVFG